MIDVPSRVLLRLQGRVALDAAAVKADLERLTREEAAAGGAPKVAAGRSELEFSVKS